ncbi:unnamed protein product [Miscanthus lutarioriparius]|uniref:Uncharacterized protein n=1 Tax=Miscanthus lutarioriparius TaxID=422564 RepID=A0A811NAC1_9POAL|nr:unnamed protein product [Miscanthus lutarioriparius]
MKIVNQQLLSWVTIVSRRIATTIALPSELIVETASEGRHAIVFSVDPGMRHLCYNRILLHGCCSRNAAADV